MRDQGRVEEPATPTLASPSVNAHDERESSAATTEALHSPRNSPVAAEIVATPAQSRSRGRQVPPELGHALRRSARIAARRAGEYAGLQKLN